jgi:hypothetical protein
VEATARDDAFRLRIAAATTAGGHARLAPFVQMRAAPPGAVDWLRSVESERLGDWFFTLSADGVATAWNMTAERPTAVPLDDYGVQSWDVDPRGRYVALIRADDVVVRDLTENGQEIRRIPVAASEWTKLGEGWIAVDDENSDTTLWDLSSSRSAGFDVGKSVEVVFGETAALVQTDDGVALWNLRTGTAASLPGDPSELTAIPDEPHMAYVGKDDNRQALWDLGASSPVSTDLGDDVVDAKLLGAAVVTVHGDGSARLRRLDRDAGTAPLVLAEAGMNAQLAPDGGHLLTLDPDGRAAIRNLATPKTAFVLAQKGAPEQTWITEGLFYVPHANGSGGLWGVGDAAPARLGGPRREVEVVDEQSAFTVLESTDGPFLWHHDSARLHRLSRPKPDEALTEDSVAVGDSWLSVSADGYATRGWYVDPAGELRLHEFGRYVTGFEGGANGRWAIISYAGPEPDTVVTVWSDLNRMPRPLGLNVMPAACAVAEGPPLTPQRWAEIAPDLPYQPTCA